MSPRLRQVVAALDRATGQDGSRCSEVSVFSILLSAALAAPLQLDLGGPLSPALEGFTSMGWSDTEHASWRVPPTSLAVGTWPDALADSTSGGALEVKGEGAWLAVRVSAYAENKGGRRGAGTWALAVDGTIVFDAEVPEDLYDFLASHHYTPVVRPVFRPGESAWERLLVHEHPWIRVAVHPTATVVLELKDRPMEAVIRAGSATELEAAIAAADDAAREDYLAHYDTTSRSPLPIGGEGLQVSGWGVTPDPKLAGQQPIWQLMATPGELTGGVVWVHGAEGPVRVSVQGLPGVEIFLSELVWYDGRGAPSRVAQPLPMVVEPISDTAAGGQGMPVGIGLRMQVSPGVAPGPHAGLITLEHDGLIRRLEVALDVLPFELDEARPSGPFLAPNLLMMRWEGGVDSPRVMRSLEASMDLLAERGFTAMALQNAEWGLDADVFVRSGFDRIMQAWQDRGGRLVSWTDVKRQLRVDAMYDDDDTVLAPHLLQRLQDMLGAASGWDMVVSVPMTEEEGWKSIEAVRRAPAYLELARWAAPPDVRISGHVSHPSEWSFTPWLDTVTWSGRPETSWANAQRITAHGADLVAYNFGGGRGGPLQAWHLGATAEVEWRFTDVPSNPFADVLANRASTFSVLATDGLPRATPWLERFAVGVQQARYLDTLERLASSPACAGPEGEAARVWLDGLHGGLDTAFRTSSFHGEIWPEHAFDRVHAETVRQLRSLHDTCVP